MLYKNTILICLYLTVLGVYSGRKSNHQTSSTSRSVLSILDKFHQTDYKMIYEWTEVVRVNKDFAEFTTKAFKYNRTTTAKNFTLFVKFDAGYNVEVIVQTYKFASNEYREFPARLQFNLSSAMDKKIWGIDKFSQVGNLTCPLLKGKRYVVVNWTPNELNLPPFIPNGRYMAEIQYMFNSTEVLVTRDYMTVYRPITVFED